MAVKARRRTPQQRLDALKLEHRRALDAIAKAKYGPIHKSEASYISSERSKARQQASGKNRKGGTSTASGRKSFARMRHTPGEQRRRDVEKEVEDFIRRNPDHPVAKQWRERTREIDELEAHLTPSPEEAFGEGRRKVRVRAHERPNTPAHVHAYRRSFPHMVRVRGR